MAGGNPGRSNRNEGLLEEDFKEPFPFSLWKRNVAGVA